MKGSKSAHERMIVRVETKFLNFFGFSTLSGVSAVSLPVILEPLLFSQQSFGVVRSIQVNVFNEI